MQEISWLSVIISILIPTAVGFGYYHKAVFGKAWMDSLGFTDDDMKGANMGMMMGVSLIMSFLLTFFLINFNNSPGQEGAFDTFKHGAFHGVFVGLIVVMPVLITNGLFERKSWKNMFINVGYWLLTLALMGGVVDAMNHWPDITG